MADSPAAELERSARGGRPPRAPEPPPSAEVERFPPPRVVAGFALMALGMFMAILDIQIVAASIGQVQAGLAASETEISWVQTSYLVAEVIMVPLSGFLMRALGMRNLFVISAAGFVVTSILCATATSIEEMILYRAAQGFIGGAMIPVTFAASFAWFPPRYKTQVTVAVALLVTLAPTIGPTVGGLLTDALSWHWIFLVNIVPGLACVFGVLWLVDRGKPDYALLWRIDLVALVFMALALGGLDYVLEEGARTSWWEDGTIVTVTVVSAVSFVFFAWRNLASREPLVDLSVLGNYNFTAACMLQLMTGVALFGITFAYPVFLGRVGGLSSGQIGTTVFLTGLTMMLLAPVAGRVARTADPRLVCSAGFLMLAASAWLSQDITADWRWQEFFWPQVLRGAGLISLIVSTTVVGFATLSGKQSEAASPLFVLVRNIGGAIGLALVNTMLIERGALHWGRLGESLNMGRADVADRMIALQALAEARGLDPDSAPIRVIAQQLQQQATVMSFGDLFHVLAIGFVAMAAVPHFLRRPPTFETAPEAY